MSSHSLIVHTNSIVSAASKAVTFQRRATRLNASVPPLRCCHPARASRATPQQKLRFCFGRLHFIPAACAERPRLRCVQSLRFLSLPIVTFSVLPRLGFWATVCLRLLHIAAASARCQPFPSGNPRLPSSSSRFVLIQLFSFFLGSRLRLMVSAPRQKLRLLSALHFAVLESASQREPSESRPFHCVLLSPKHLPTMFSPRPPTPLGVVLL